MTEQDLAQFFERAGFEVLAAANRFWFRASRHIYQALPIVNARGATHEELRPLFDNHLVLGAQYASVSGPGLPTGQQVVTDPDYGLKSLQRQFRQHVRRGLANCELRSIPFMELHDCAVEVNRDAASRRDYMAPHFVQPQLWQRFCRAGESTPGSGVLASFVGTRLAAYVVYFQVADQVIALYVVSDGRLRAHHPNHCLYYEFARRMISRDTVNCVGLGLLSLTGRISIDRFKVHAGFELQPCFQSTVLRPAARRVFQNALTRRCVGAIDKATRGKLQRVQQVIQQADASS